MKANIKTALYKLIPVALLNLLRHVIAQLTGNTALAEPPVPLEDMTTAANQLETAIERAVNGSQHDRAVRNTLVKKVRDILTKTANYVRATANGDIDILTSSGFDLAKVPERVGLPGAPQGLVVRPGELLGTIDLRWRRERGATSYKVMRSALDPSVEANWETVALTSTVHFTDTDLVGYKPYWYQVSAIGYAGEGAYSAIVMARAA
jgi:hypothetical protein